MEQKDLKQFLVYWAMAEEAYKENTSKERIEIYFEFLKEFSMEEVGEAFRSALKKLDFFPKISQLRKFILQARIFTCDKDYYSTFQTEHREDAIFPEIANIRLVENFNKLDKKEKN